MSPLNPFSNRTTVSSSDYIQRKRNLTKIAYLKEMPWKNFKTSTYVVCENKKCKTKKCCCPTLPTSYPEPSFPYQMPHYETNLYYHDEMKDYTASPSTPYLPTINQCDTVYVTCEKCGYAIQKMDKNPVSWVCDHWKPPYSSCERGNGVKLNQDITAYCCQNVKNCNYVICDKC